MTWAVSLTARASRHADKIDKWWTENRPAARTLFRDELAETLVNLAATPEAGRRVRNPHVPNQRRILLRPTRHHVYYVMYPDERRVVVNAIWSAHRGSRPPLKPE